jgi:sugar fermentation stimulation protein A
LTEHDRENPVIVLPQLHKAEFLCRLNRFVGEISLRGAVYRSHVPSSGRMKELLYPGATVHVAENTGKDKKTAYRILLAEYGDTLVSVDSLLPNRLVGRALKTGLIRGFEGCSTVRPEAPFGSSRFDFFLADGNKECFLEVKSVTLVNGGVALFPDAPSARGSRHLEELAAAAREGYRAAVLFLIQRDDAVSFSPNDAGDPVFGAALRRAAAAGVEITAIKCVVKKHGVALDGEVPVEI